MKSATIPSVRVEPEFRAEVEVLLREGESLSEFVEQAVREQARRRRNEAEFIARGIRALEESRRDQTFFDTEFVLARLRAKLESARQRKAELDAERGMTATKSQ